MGPDLLLWAVNLPRVSVELDIGQEALLGVPVRHHRRHEALLRIREAESHTLVFGEEQVPADDLLVNDI